MFLYRSPKRRRGIAGFADDLEAFEATDFLLESGTAMMTSVTQKEAPENYEKNGYVAEENEQEMLAKQKENGKHISLGTASGKNQTASCSLG